MMCAMNSNATSPLPEIDSNLLQTLVMDVALAVLAGDEKCQVSHKSDGSWVTQVDIALQKELHAVLCRHWPDIPLLGEEMDLSNQRRVMSSEAFWCLDPLDGTTNFVSGIPFFAISLALVRNGEVVCAVVYDPSHRECFRADIGRGAWLNDQPLTLPFQGSELAQCVALVDFKRLPKHLVERIAERSPYRSQRSLGSVALEWCWLAAGRAQLYLHGAQRIWDYAAGLLIFKESGGCGCIMDLVSGDCLGIDREIEARAAIGASEQALLQQWKDWLYAADPD
jgi:myo-inositol-1(or 4)-monophosphatase